MKITEIEIDGKKAMIIDDFYSSLSDIESLYLTACSLPFFIKGKPAEDIQNRHNLRMVAELNSEILNRIKLFEGERGKFLEKHVPIDEYSIYRAYCNLGLISDYQEAHVDTHHDAQSLTLLIYCNKEWKDNWGGETYFYSDDMSEIKYVSKITRGRALLFDGSIPHIAKVQHNYSDNYRLTIPIKFVKKEIKINDSNAYDII